MKKGLKRSHANYSLNQSCLRQHSALRDFEHSQMHTKVTLILPPLKWPLQAFRGPLSQSFSKEKVADKKILWKIRRGWQKNNEKSRNSCNVSGGGVGAGGMETYLSGSSSSWNQQSTLTVCFCCHIYCAQVRRLEPRLLVLPRSLALPGSKKIVRKPCLWTWFVMYVGLEKKNLELTQDIWGAQQLRTGCLSILMFLAPLAEVTP